MTPSNGFARARIWLALILLLGLWLRLWGARWGLPHQYQTEEYKVIKYALRMGGGDLNPHFFEYPSLYHYFMLAVYGATFLLGRLAGRFHHVHDFALFYAAHPGPFHLIGRVVESLFGIGVVLLAYRIGKAAFNERAGLWGALILAVLPSAVNTCHATKGDMAALCLGALFWLCTLGIARSGELKYYLLSGALLGLAFSTKYYMAMMGIALPVAHFLNPRRPPHLRLLIALALIPVFFALGTPYALLSQREFLTFFQQQKGAFAAFTGHPMTYGEKARMAAIKLLKMSDLSREFLLGSYGLGLLCLAGTVLLFVDWKREHLLFLAPLAAYALIVASYHNPAAGYMAPIFPLLAACGGAFLARMTPEPSDKSAARLAKVGALLFAFLAVGSSLGESARLDYAYTLPDTRTLARDWIVRNIPAGTPILLDLPADSPPLDHSNAQLAKFHEIALRLNNYKKDYFALLLETRAGKPEEGYEIFQIKRTPGEIGSLPYQVAQAQQVQDLVEVRGTDGDFAELKKAGIRYFAESGWCRDLALNNHEPGLEGFYRSLPAKAELVREFKPASKLHPGPEIRVYRF